MNHILNTLYQLCDERGILELSALAVGSSLTAICYAVHQNFKSKARTLNDIPILEINDGLKEMVQSSPFSSLPYVAVRGTVTSNEPLLYSHFDPSLRGIYLERTTKEHLEVWGKYSHVWMERDRDVTKIKHIIPFQLSGNCGFSNVSVIEPKKSSWFADNPEVVSEVFTPVSSTTMESIINYVSGEKTKGFTETEKMLKVGTQLCAIGELAIENNILIIRPPTTGDYIISNLSHPGIVKNVQGSATTWKIFALLMGAATVTSAYFIIRRMMKKYRDIKTENAQQLDIDEIRNQRTARIARMNRSDNQNGDELCVVCLVNPRECVLLNCGHICICVDCLATFPQPVECPICRSIVIRTVPLFNA